MKAQREIYIMDASQIEKQNGNDPGIQEFPEVNSVCCHTALMSCMLMSVKSVVVNLA